MKAAYRSLMGVAAMAAVIGATGAAHAFNPQPDPPKELLLCEVQTDGTLTLLAFDASDFAGDLRVGMSCLGALSVVRRKGQEFDVEWFDGMDGAAKLGIIITDKKPAEF